MADYEVLVSRRAADEIEDLPKSIATRVYAKLEALAHEPRPSGVKKLRGSAKGWRIRVGDYRAAGNRPFCRQQWPWLGQRLDGFERAAFNSGG